MDTSGPRVYTRLEAYSRFNRLWGSSAVGEHIRRRIVDLVLSEFDRSVQDSPGTRPDSRIISNIVLSDPEVKKAIPLIFILGPIISWVVGKFLDWLWDNYSKGIVRDG